MSLHWASPTRSFSGLGDLGRFEPASGADRYRETLSWLAETGRELAVASYTFDLADHRSVVLAPERLGPNPVPADGSIRSNLIESGRTAWESAFASAHRELSSGVVGKVVLARKVTLEADTVIDVDLVFSRLTRANPHTYVFAVEGLLGASPELLVSVTGDRVRSVALAGTTTGAADLGDVRIVREHDMAADSVAAALGPHVSHLETRRSIVEVGRIRHLATSFEGAILPGKGIVDLLVDLHPTAAVAGTPTDLAMDLIRRVEPAGRGRYAGPVGWLDAQGNGEFAIALRCGVIREDQATLYAGGGLVMGADLDQEWAETEAKLRPMYDALGVE
jgi:menaquinone-specific isochorismate synthase